MQKHNSGGCKQVCQALVNTAMIEIYWSPIGAYLCKNFCLVSKAGVLGRELELYPELPQAHDCAATLYS